MRLEGVGINPARIGLLGILTRMGAAIEVVETAAAGNEPVATIVARSGPLQATRVGGGEVPLAIDELPLVALAGCFADGETVVSGAEELRHKESDRIATVVDGLRRARRRDRGDRGRLRRRRRPAACAAARSTPRATTAWRCSARSPASPRGDGVEVRGFEAAGGQLPGLRGRPGHDARALTRARYAS